MMVRLLLPGPVHDQLRDQLTAAAPHETGAFCLLYEGRGATGRRFIVGDIVCPDDGSWTAQDTDRLVPSSSYVSRAISVANTHRAGLLFVHSHPSPRHPVGLSRTDEETILRLATTISALVDGPLVAAVVHPEGWAAVCADDGQLTPIPTAWKIDAGLTPLHPAPQAVDHLELDDRQRDALQQMHEVVRGLSVGVVGVGGNGSPIAEQLVRLGVREVVLVEKDHLDTPSNVRRVIGSTAADLVATRPPRKVDVVGRHLDQLGLAVQVRRVHGDVADPAALRHLLDCDIVVGATDTHTSRSVLTQLPTAHLLPVVDVGVRVAAFGGTLGGLWTEVRRLTPAGPCLWCAGVLDADRIRAENLDDGERDRELEEGYLPDGVGAPAPSVIPLNTLAGGLAASALLALLTPIVADVPPVYRVDGLTGDCLRPEIERDPGCDCSRPATGDLDARLPTFAEAAHG